MKFLRFGIAIITCFFSCIVLPQEIPKLKPELVVDNHSICDSLMSSVLDAHRRKGWKYFPRENGVKGILVPTETKGFSGGLTIEGKHVYLRSHTNPGCGGGCETYQVLASASEVPSFRDREKRDAYRKLLEKSPPASSGGTLLAKSASGEYFGVVETSSFLSVHQLTPDAEWLESCKIKLRPEQISEIPGLPETLAASIENFRTTRNEMAGGAGQCGSLRTAGRITYRFGRDLPLLISRPWVLEANEKSGHRSYPAVFERLENWSLKGIGSYETFENHKKALLEVKGNLSGFYTNHFGWDVRKSEDIAKKALEGLIVTGFSFPWHSHESMAGETELRRSILAGDKISQIRFDYKRYKSELEKNGGNPESLLTIAVKNPPALRYLLEQGLSVDRPNPFGKTALMYAVQYDNLEAVKLLLAAGADVNAETHIPLDSCNYTIKTSGYTPLHYASRYASRNLVELLLDAGASPYARTGGRYSENKEKYPRDWLAENDKLSIEDEARLRTELSVPPLNEAKFLSAKLNREAERAYGEGDKDSAYKMLRTAIQLDGANHRALSNMSLVALRAGDHRRALQAGLDLTKSDAPDKLKAAAYFNIALSLEDFFTQNPRKWALSLGSDRYLEAHVMDSLLMAYKLAPNEARAEKLRTHLEKVANVNCPEAGDSSFFVTNRYDWSLVGEQRKRAQRIAILRRGVSGVGKVCWSSDFSSGSKRICVSEGEAYGLGDYFLSVFTASDYQLGDKPSYSVAIDDLSCGSRWLYEKPTELN